MKTSMQMSLIIGLLPVCACLAAAQSDRTQRLLRLFDSVRVATQVGWRLRNQAGLALLANNLY